MALSATIYQVQLSLADSDRELYLDERLTLALHPSETPARMVTRLLAWAMYSAPALAFGRGISTREDPDLWEKDIHENVLHWIEVGEPDPDRLRKAALQSAVVTVIPYGRQWKQWWQRNEKVLRQMRKLQIRVLHWEAVEQLADNLPRSFNWQITISEGELFVTDHRGQMINLVPQRPG